MLCHQLWQKVIVKTRVNFSFRGKHEINKIAVNKNKKSDMKKRIYLPGLILGCLMLMAVVSRAASVPVTTGNLANDTVCTGATATFIFTASDTSATPAAITYTWQVSTNGFYLVFTRFRWSVHHHVRYFGHCNQRIA